jgi:hypothetical protein
MLFRKIMGTDWANIRTTEGSVRKTSRFWELNRWQKCSYCYHCSNGLRFCCEINQYALYIYLEIFQRRGKSRHRLEDRIELNFTKKGYDVLKKVYTTTNRVQFWTVLSKLINPQNPWNRVIFDSVKFCCLRRFILFCYSLCWLPESRYCLVTSLHISSTKP